MATPNGQNPSFPGKVTAKGFATKKGTLANYAFKKTVGTVKQSVFGATPSLVAEFGGSFIGMKITSKDDANGTISLYTDNGVLVASITKGSQGAVKGSTFTAVAFTSTGTPYVVSSTAGDADVEVMFTSNN